MNQRRRAMDVPASRAPAGRPRTAAFTLIEMCIVLVIIGLIVGGVLVGRDLIKAASVRSEITEMENLQTQIFTFRTKYDCYPGDCTNVTSLLGSSDAAGHAISNGDGDGLIRASAGQSAGECSQGANGASELTQLFLQLNVAGLGNYASDGSNAKLGIGWPMDTLGNTTGLLVSCLTPISNPFNAPLDPALNSGNIIVVGAEDFTANAGGTRIAYLVGTNTWPSPNPPMGIPLEIAQRMDQKIDDRLAEAGSFGVISAAGAGGGWWNIGCLGGAASIGGATYAGASGGCMVTVGKKTGF